MSDSHPQHLPIAHLTAVPTGHTAVIQEWAKVLLLLTYKDFSHLQIFLMVKCLRRLPQWEQLAVLKTERTCCQPYVRLVPHMKFEENLQAERG